MEWIKLKHLYLSFLVPQSTSFNMCFFDVYMVEIRNIRNVAVTNLKGSLKKLEMPNNMQDPDV